ncbi:MAG: phosphate ABC transporter permease PstA [Pseudomonadota bacterium]
MKKRHRSEQLFRAMGLGSIAVGLAFLAILMTSIIGNGYSAFWQTHIALEVDFAQSRLDPDASGDPEVIGKANFGGLVKRSMRAAFPDVKSRRDKRALYKLVSSGAAFQLRAMAMDEPRLIGQKLTVWVPADDDIDMLMKGYVDRKLPESDRRINNKTLAWVDKLSERGAIEKHFNITFFTAGDSREPELSGIHGALMGSLYMLMVTLVLSFPIGVGAAIYLEEFAPRNRFSDFIEVNVNNLAAVPSIVFGLLGLAVFLNFFQLPRSAPLVGGLVLTLMTLPTIIIASRAALKSVPPSIREAALGIGASKMQMVMQHALPLAMPGMLTGTIIGMARALGESAPLLMIGMVAFVVDVPDGPLDPATALPVQVYLWADSPERAFVERTSAAIIVLLVLLVGTNALAVFLRRKFERRW